MDSGLLYVISLRGYQSLVRMVLVEELIDVDVEAKAEHYGTALQVASYDGNIEVVRMLLDAGARVNIPPLDRGYTSKDEIVLRKVDGVNAWIDYAWKFEPKEPKPKPQQNQTEMRTPSTVGKQVDAPQAILQPGRPIAPKPWYASMITDPKCSGF
jgi:hypothetical protein